MYLLDTDHWTILQLQAGDEFERLAAKIQRLSGDECFVSIVTFHEVMNGWLKYLAKPKNSSSVVRGYERLEFLLDRFASAQIMPFSDKASEIFTELRTNRIRVATMDLRIASIAISHQLTLVTRNLVDFERVPGLTIEDWLK